MAANTPDVLIIGAGMAGLAAANSLASSGLRVVLLEAQHHIGGRVLTRRIGDQVIELGAEFVHGRPPELWSLIEEAGLTVTEHEGTRLSFHHGALTSDTERDGAAQPLEDLADFTGPDLSFADYLDRQPLSPEQRAPLISYVEGFNAADHRQISTASLADQQQAEDAVDGSRLYHVVGGYDQVAQYLARRITARGGSIRLGERVREIRWRSGKVTVLTANDSFTAPQAVITVPLGVLQAERILIAPRPDAILAAATQLRMGSACRFTLLFRERFWAGLSPQPALADLSFLLAFDQMPPVWWTPHPEPGNTITGWIGGPRSSTLAALEPRALGRLACETLARIFRIDTSELQQQLLGCYTHNWQNDPNILGAYSYVAAGGMDASRRMTQPLADTLYFAGEHTDVTGHWGTVHAAIRSGLRAARQILET